MSFVHSGNAQQDGTLHRGWFLGHFIDPADSPMHSDDVEVKWDAHKAGEKRETWAPAEDVRTISILVRGSVTIRFPDKDVLLSKEGDYVAWQGVAHIWETSEDNLVISVRWPSVDR